MPGSTHHQVLMVGGGTAGITVSAILSRGAVGINLAIVEPEHDHYYQPAFTLVGAGVYPLARTRRAEESLIPIGVQWIRNGAQTFEPENNTFRRRLYRRETRLGQGRRACRDPRQERGMQQLLTRACD